MKIKMRRGCPAIEEHLTYILNDLVISLEDVFSPHFPFPPFFFTHQSRKCPIETGLMIIKGTERPDRFPHIWKVIYNALKILTHFISTYNKDASKSSKIIVQTLLIFLSNLKQKYNAQRLRFLWKEAMVISIEFNNPVDLKAFIECSYLLREDTKYAFNIIFSNVNEFQFPVPYIEIRNASISSKWRRFIIFAH